MLATVGKKEVLSLIADTHDMTEVRKEADLYGTAPQPVLL